MRMSQRWYCARTWVRKARKSSPRLRGRTARSRWPVAGLSVPKTVRRALLPVIGPRAGVPRFAQPARRGGTSRSSVSSSKRTTVGRAGLAQAVTWAQSAAFFLIEIWFSILVRAALTGASFTAIRQRREAIDRFIAAWNPTAHPFEWTKEVVHQGSLKTRYADLLK